MTIKGGVMCPSGMGRCVHQEWGDVFKIKNTFHIYMEMSTKKWGDLSIKNGVMCPSGMGLFITLHVYIYGDDHKRWGDVSIKNGVLCPSGMGLLYPPYEVRTGDTMV